MKQHQARKRFGQNFLTDQTIIQQIIQLIQPRKNDQLVEIGPGLGALTFPLLLTTQKLTAIELDRDLIPQLKAKTQNMGELQIHQADVLKFQFSTLHSKALRIIGNLPYNISTPLLFHLFDQKNLIQDMHFMLQKEVVDRLAAQPHCAAYGKLSIMAQYHCQILPLLDIPPSAFDPKPKVNSSFVRLIPHQQPPVLANHFQHFENLVKTAFQQRRKTIRNNLKNFIDEEILIKLELDPNLRPENLSVRDYVMLSNHSYDVFSRKQ